MKNTFLTHYDHFKFLVIPFRLTNMSHAFIDLMNKTFKTFLEKFLVMLVYSSKKS